MSTVEEKPTPPHLISPLPPPSLSPWSPNTSKSNDPARYRKSSKREQNVSYESKLEPHPPLTIYDGDFKESISNGSLDPMQLVFRLERNLRFLKEQHFVVTTSLHREIEELKKKNKSLQFNLVMGVEYSSGSGLHQSASDEVAANVIIPLDVNEERVSRTSSASNTRRSCETERTSSDLRRHLAMIESENRELGVALSDARNRNLFLSSRIEQMKRQASGIHNYRLHTPESVQVNEIPPIYAQRLEEFEDMLQQQKRENLELQTELARLKAMIREILSSNKWSTEAYGLARSVLQEGHNGRDQRFQQRLPRIPIRPHEPQRLPSLPSISSHSPFPGPVVRGQQSLPNIATPNSKSRSNPSNPGQYNQRYKSPIPQKKKQQRN